MKINCKLRFHLEKYQKYKRSASSWFVKRMITVVDLTSIVADFQYSVAMQFILTKDVNLFEGKKESYKVTEA